jgi:hypothetical protein
MVARVTPADEDHAPVPQNPDRYRALSRQLLGQPGVMHVAHASVAPGVASDPFPFEVGEDDRAGTAVSRWCRRVRVDSSYFETLGLSTVSGRVFTPADVEHGGRVAVVDETFVRLQAGGRHPVGMMIRGDDDRDTWFEIVGVVRDLSVTGRRKPTDATIYFPETFRSGTPVHVIIRTSPGSSGLTYRLELAATVEGLRLSELQPAADVAETAAFEVRLSLVMTAVIGGVTLLLSVAGIYALISFTVSRRTREMGIRSALGASPARVVSGVLSGALWRIAVGVTLGAAPAIAVLSLGAEDSDGLGVGGGALGTLLICAGLMGVAAIAGAGPLRSAFRNDPVAALRADA